MKNFNAQRIADENFYTELTYVASVGWCALHRFMFTVGILCAIDETGYRFRFCFDTYLNASLFLNDWDGKTLPIVGIDGCTAIK